MIPRTVVEDLKKTNDTLSDENVQLRSQVTVVLVSLFLWYFTFTVALHVDLCGKCPVTVYHVVEFHLIVWAFFSALLSVPCCFIGGEFSQAASKP